MKSDCEYKVGMAIIPTAAASAAARASESVCGRGGELRHDANETDMEALLLARERLVFASTAE